MFGSIFLKNIYTPCSQGGVKHHSLRVWLDGSRLRIDSQVSRDHGLIYADHVLVPVLFVDISRKLNCMKPTLHRFWVNFEPWQGLNDSLQMKMNFIQPLPTFLLSSFKSRKIPISLSCLGICLKPSLSATLMFVPGRKRICSNRCLWGSSTNWGEN